MSKAARPAGALALDLTIPGDERFVDTVRALSIRFAQHVGYAEAEAQAIGGAVDRAVRGAVASECDRDSEMTVEIHFATGDGCVTIEVRYPTAAGAAAGPDATGLKQRRGPVGERSDTLLDALHGVMDQVEFGQNDHMAYCRLRRSLPTGQNP